MGRDICADSEASALGVAPENKHREISPHTCRPAGTSYHSSSLAADRAASCCWSFLLQLASTKLDEQGTTRQPVHTAIFSPSKPPPNLYYSSSSSRSSRIGSGNHVSINPPGEAFPPLNDSEMPCSPPFVPEICIKKTSKWNHVLILSCLIGPI